MYEPDEATVSMTKSLDEFRFNFPKKDYVVLNELRYHGGSLLMKVFLDPILVFEILEVIYGPYEDIHKKSLFIDDKSSWERVFETPSGILRVYDFKGSTSIGYSAKLTPELQKEGEEFKVALEV